LKIFEIEEGIRLDCNFKGKAGREELINAVAVILTDEAKI